MDLRPSEEQQQLRDALRRLFDRRVAALVEALPDPPRHDPTRDLGDAVALGLTGLGLPAEQGGAGTFSDVVVAHEELGRGLAGPLLPALAAVGRLLVRATGDGRDELLATLADGIWTATVAFADAGACRRVIAGPDVADVLIIAADADGGAEVHVVPAATPGLDWQEEATGCDLVSWTATVPDPMPAHLLHLTAGAVDAYRADVAILAAARQVGGARAVLDRTLEHVRTREQFDRAIGTFQAVQHQLADVATELDATELAVLQAGWAVDAVGSATECRRLAAIAAVTAAAAFRTATLVAHQLHGGMGFVLDSPLHLWSARAIADPTVPLTRRQLLDALADASGITADGVAVPPDHRLIRQS